MPSFPCCRTAQDDKIKLFRERLTEIICIIQGKSDYSVMLRGGTSAADHAPASRRRQESIAAERAGAGAPFRNAAENSARKIFTGRLKNSSAWAIIIPYRSAWITVVQSPDGISAYNGGQRRRQVCRGLRYISIGVLFPCLWCKPHPLGVLFTKRFTFQKYLGQQCGEIFMNRRCRKKAPGRYNDLNHRRIQKWLNL